jgi:hypothetical protein
MTATGTSLPLQGEGQASTSTRKQCKINRAQGDRAVTQDGETVHRDRWTQAAAHQPLASLAVERAKVHACFHAEAVDVRRPRTVGAPGEPNVVVGEQPLLRASVLVDLLEASAREPRQAAAVDRLVDRSGLVRVVPRLTDQPATPEHPRHARGDNRCNTLDVRVVGRPREVEARLACTRVEGVHTVDRDGV